MFAFKIERTGFSHILVIGPFAIGADEGSAARVLKARACQVAGLAPAGSGLLSEQGKLTRNVARSESRHEVTAENEPARNWGTV
jgi:hypothetical protein